MTNNSPGGPVANSDVIDRLLSPEQRQADLRAEQRARFIQVVVFLTLIIIVGTWVWGAVVTFQRPAIGQITISDVQTIGPTDLCPGDFLKISYNFVASGQGVLDVDQTAWKISPPQTVIFSSSNRIVLVQDVEETVNEAWRVPESYLDPATGEDAPLPTGDYQRNLAITSPNRTTVASVAAIPFSIKRSCPKRGK